MKYLSVCSGIEAATCAWHPLGWEPVGFAEIDRFPSAVLAHRYPHVPNHGDFTRIESADVGSIDLLVGGTPCQSFSVAGLRGGLADDRGNLALEFLRLAYRARPKWLVWENVPGVLSSNGGRDFGSILGGLGELGYGWSYRVLDAQYFGVPQRRRRVFVVGCLGSRQRAAAVLFERHCLQGHPPPSRQAGEGIAPTIASRPTGGGGLGTDFDCDGGLTIAKPILAGGHANNPLDENLLPLQVHGAHGSNGAGIGVAGDPMMTLQAGVAHAIAFNARQDPDSGPVTHPLDTDGTSIGVALPIGTRVDRGGSHREAEGNNLIPFASAVRRLTPRECEALQGFRTDYTLIPYRGKPAADGPRYKALGNSMAVPAQ